MAINYNKYEKGYRFPDGFLFGASTSAYQFEGGAHLGGKSSSQQDVINMNNEKLYGFANAEIASDHYHHWREDVKIMKEMGLRAYRFSMSWPRILPNGTGEVNPEGLKFYHDLIDCLRENGIEPIVTMYHYDLPWCLVEKYGGWLDRQVIEDFEYYVRTIITEFKDKVKYWVTINEQGIIVQYHYKKCFLTEEQKANNQLRYQINHYMNLAHARACNVVHELAPNCMVGAVTAYSPIYPVSNKPEDMMAALNAHDFRNNYYFDIWFKGQYSTPTMLYLESRGMAPVILEGDMEAIKSATTDFVAINYYRSDCAMHSEPDDEEHFMGVNLTGKKGTTDNHETHPGFYKMCKNENLETNDWDWSIDPVGLEYALRDVYSRYHKPMMILENGIGAFDSISEDGHVHDQYRIDYLKGHVQAVKRAMDMGVKVLAYCPWSCIDLLSTTNGYYKRYGLVYVDRTNDDPKKCERIRKDSSYWYQRVIETNGVSSEED